MANYGKKRGQNDQASITRTVEELFLFYVIFTRKIIFGLIKA